MEDENKEKNASEDSTIIGSDAKKIISKAKQTSENTQIINIDTHSTDNDADISQAPPFEQLFQFSKEDVLGENWDSADKFDPYSNTHLDLPNKKKSSVFEKKKKDYIMRKKKNNAKKTVKSKSGERKRTILKKHTANNKKNRRNWNSFKKAVFPVSLVILIFAVIFVILYVLCSSSLPADTIAKNIYIESLNVSGMTYDEALNSVKATYLFENQTVTLRCGGHSFEFDGVDIGLSASPEETTKKAFNYTKSDNEFLNGLRAVTLLFHKHTIVPVANIDEEKLNEKLIQFGTEIYGELVGHYVEVRDNNESTVWPGHSGFDGDTEKAKKEILNAFSQERFKSISVSLSSTPPPDITIEQYDTAVYKDPENAHYDVKDNNVTVVPEVNGRYIDKDKVAPLLSEVKEGREPVIVPWETAYADVTAETLQSKLFSSTLASYSTYYGSSTANRSANVARASNLLNGAVVASGNIFSFNTQVGERTKYNGFYTAPEYSDGQTVEGIGGGTCQVSTTLYSAVLYAGLDIISRTNHMFSVSYAPLGQDATVSDTGIDFQFRNNTDYPVKIKSYTDGTNIYVDIIGTAWEPAREFKIDNTVSYSSGGTSVYSKRYVYENGECVSTEKLPSSYYKVH